MKDVGISSSEEQVLYERYIDQLGEESYTPLSSKHKSSRPSTQARKKGTLASLMRNALLNESVAFDAKIMLKNVELKENNQIQIHSLTPNRNPSKAAPKDCANRLIS